MMKQLLLTALVSVAGLTMTAGCESDNSRPDRNPDAYNGTPMGTADPGAYDRARDTTRRDRYYERDTYYNRDRDRDGYYDRR